MGSARWHVQTILAEGADESATLGLWVRRPWACKGTIAACSALHAMPVFVSSLSNFECCRQVLHFEIFPRPPPPRHTHTETLGILHAAPMKPRTVYLSGAPEVHRLGAQIDCFTTVFSRRQVGPSALPTCCQHPERGLRHGQGPRAGY